MADERLARPQIPGFLRLVTAFEVMVVLVAAGGLFFFPVAARELWAWSAAPFNSRQMGAIYFAALLPLLMLALNGRWDGGRGVLWMIFAFTGVVMLAMLIHADKFQWSRISTWGFWFLYLFLPVNSAIYLYRLRTWSQPCAGPTPLAARRILDWIAFAGGFSLGRASAIESCGAAYSGRRPDRVGHHDACRHGLDQ